MATSLPEVTALGIDPCASGTLAGQRLVALDGERERVNAAYLMALGEFAAESRHEVDGATSAPAWVAHRCEVGGRQARAEVKTATGLRAMRHVAAALADGSLCVAKVEMLAKARVAVDTDLFADHEEHLVATIAGLTVDHATRAVRYWISCAEALVDGDGEKDPGERRRDRRRLHLNAGFDGTWKLDGVLDPETGARLRAAIDARYEELRRNEEPEARLLPGQRRADALADLVLGGVDGQTEPDDCDADGAEATSESDAAPDHDEPGRGHAEPRRSGGDGKVRPARSPKPFRLPPPAPDFTAALDLDALLDGRDVVGELADGLPLFMGPARRLLCNCTLSSVVFRNSEPIDLGRTSRLPTRAQRRALARRDGGCAFPGCDRGVGWCDAHHIIHWLDGGLTDVDNLVLLCRYHHHLVHEGEFSLTGQISTGLEFHRPDGSPLSSPRNRPPGLFEHTGTRPPPRPPPLVAV